MKVNVIYTFENKPQKFTDISLTEVTWFNKEMFFVLITAGLTTDEKENLVKISCCVRVEKAVKEPSWYENQSGKFYDDEIPALMKKLHGIICTYEPINKP